MATLSTVGAISALATAGRGATYTERAQRWVMLRDHARGLREAVVHVDDALVAFDARQATAATATRPAVLDSGVITLGTATASTRGSTEEINTSSTSFSPYAPEWDGASAASVTLTGTYTGAADDTLTFRVAQVPLLGLGSYRVQVRDGTGAVTDTLTFSSASGTKTFSLANGIEVAIGPGALSFGDELTFDVYAERGTDIDPDAALGGTGAARADLEDGFTVTDGSFTVNGVSIAVATSDSLHDVLDRITASSADVTATYDVATDSVVLTRKTAGALDIALADDTSGLLDALKLSGSTTTSGHQDELTSPLAGVAAFAGLTAGNLTIDGTAVAVNPAVDSLQAVLDRITATTTATATWDAGTSRVLLRSDSPTGTPTIGADQTGLLAALGLKAAYDITVLEYGPLRPQARELVVDALGHVAQRLTGLRSLSSGRDRSAAASGLLADHARVVGAMFDEHQRVLARLAVPQSGPAVDSAATDVRTRRLVELQQSSDGYAAILRGSRSVTDDGYLDRVRDLFRRTAEELEREAELVW